MKPAKSVTFLLLLLLITVQGIRLNHELIPEAPTRIHVRKERSLMDRSRVYERGHRRPTLHCRRSLCPAHANSRPLKRAHQRMPSLHADYFGPRIHDPKHH